MARQRFIWPDIWKDPVFGKLLPVEQVMFIGLFSIADDEGRTLADAAYLRSELFAYKDYTTKKVQTIRDAVVGKADNVHLYRAGGFDYIALLKWSDYQKPKYPKASKIPPPFLEHSPILPPTLPEDSLKTSTTGRAGMGRDGLERAGFGSGDDDATVHPIAPTAEIENEVQKMLKLNGVDENSEGVIRSYAKQLPIDIVARIRFAAQDGHRGVGWAINGMKDEINERSAA